MAERVQVRDRELRCQHCGETSFHRKNAALDQPLLGGWLTGRWHQAALYVCAACGLAHLFLDVEGAQPRVETPVPPPAAEDACVSCGARVPPEATRCPACGLSWGAAEDVGG